jgi:hypothetical protein
MAGEMVEVPRELLERILETLESNWHQIEREWGDGRDLDDVVAQGGEPEIAELRKLLGR